MGTVDVPHTGLTVAGKPAVLQRQTLGRDGAGLAAAGRSAHPARVAWIAPAVIAVAARLRVSRPFSVGTFGRIDVIVDLLNVLNDTSEEALSSDTFDRPNFAKPTVFIDPRRAMLGVRLNLGAVTRSG